MALTPEDFLRGVPLALRGLDYRVNGSDVAAGSAEHGLSITLRPLPPRKLGTGLLALARCEVTISFRGYDEAERSAFLQHFDQVYRRGGG